MCFIVYALFAIFIASLCMSCTERFHNSTPALSEGAAVWPWPDQLNYNPPLNPPVEQSKRVHFMEMPYWFRQPALLSSGDVPLYQIRNPILQGKRLF